MPNWISNIFKKKTTVVVPYKTESDFSKMKKWDDYSYQKRIRNFGLSLLQGGALGVLAVISYAIITDETIRARVVDLVLTNITGITYALLTIAGISISNDKKDSA